MDNGQKKEFCRCTALFVFFGYIAVDGLYVQFTKYVVEGNPHGAAFCTVTINLLVAFGISRVVQNWRYFFPIAVGSFIGTYVSVLLNLEYFVK